MLVNKAHWRCKMKIEYKTNFEGYFPLLRAILYLLKEKRLSFTEFGVYVCLIAQVDFHESHKTYGVIIRSDNEISHSLGCDSTTIFKHRKALIDKGFLIERDGLTVVPNFYLFRKPWPQRLAKISSVFLQDLFAKPQEEIPGLQELIAKLQKHLPQKAIQSFNLSSKVDLGSSEGLRSYDANLEEGIDSYPKELDNESIGDEDE